MYACVYVCMYVGMYKSSAKSSPWWESPQHKIYKQETWMVLSEASTFWISLQMPTCNQIIYYLSLSSGACCGYFLCVFRENMQPRNDEEVVKSLPEIYKCCI